MRTTKRDYSVDQRLLLLAALALLIGVISTLAANLLLKLIHLFTNLFFFQTFSLLDRSPASNGMGVWAILMPVAGGLLVGLLARYGSEKIRGHGIPERWKRSCLAKAKCQPASRC